MRDLKIVWEDSKWLSVGDETSDDAGFFEGIMETEEFRGNGEMYA